MFDGQFARPRNELLRNWTRSAKFWQSSGKAAVQDADRILGHHRLPSPIAHGPSFRKKFPKRYVAPQKGNEREASELPSSEAEPFLSKARLVLPCLWVMRWVVGLLLAAATVAGVFAQEELGLVGRYDDVRQIPDNYTKETNQFVFTRLIYNGRIPGYYKNWYTDYPRADRNLIAVLKRLT